MSKTSVALWALLYSALQTVLSLSSGMWCSGPVLLPHSFTTVFRCPASLAACFQSSVTFLHWIVLWCPPDQRGLRRPVPPWTWTPSPRRTASDTAWVSPALASASSSTTRTLTGEQVIIWAHVIWGVGGLFYDLYIQNECVISNGYYTKHFPWVDDLNISVHCKYIDVLGK